MPMPQRTSMQSFRAWNQSGSITRDLHSRTPRMIILDRLQAPARRLKATVLALVIAALLFDLPGASAQDQFYDGKQIKLITHVGPASGYSVWARLVGAHLGRHIPGTPSIIVQNMPGSGGLQATNYIYSLASKDGLELGALNRLVPTWSIMGYRGATFDAAHRRSDSPD